MIGTDGESVPLCPEHSLILIYDIHGDDDDVQGEYKNISQFLVANDIKTYRKMFINTVTLHKLTQNISFFSPAESLCTPSMARGQ